MHDDVHVRDDRAAQGCRPHPPEHRVELSERPRRRGPSQRRGHPGDGADVPHCGAQHDLPADAAERGSAPDRAEVRRGVGHRHHRAQRVTLLFGVPTMFAALAESTRWATADLSSLRLLLCGGAPVPRSLITRYHERGLSFVQGYGMTETAPRSAHGRSEHEVTRRSVPPASHISSLTSASSEVTCRTPIRMSPVRSSSGGRT